MKKLIGLAALVALGLAACGAPPEVVSGADTINAADLANHIETLSSDEFEGRAPSSPGEEKTVAYIAEYFNAYGLRPGNGESYFQEVPLVDIRSAYSPISGGLTSVITLSGPHHWTNRKSSLCTPSWFFFDFTLFTYCPTASRSVIVSLDSNM